MDRVAANQGRVFIAEADGRAIGWGVFIVEQNPLFIIEAERNCGYIAELFVVEASRSLGVGRALIAACEDEARRLGLNHVKIGVLTANRRSAGIYELAGYAPYSSELRKYL
jgi:GNAT superfamily N-acetyltransferase